MSVPYVFPSTDKSGIQYCVGAVQLELFANRASSPLPEWKVGLLARKPRFQQSIQTDVCFINASKARKPEVFESLPMCGLLSRRSLPGSHLAKLSLSLPV